MYFNGHDIIKFATKRWIPSKKDIELIYLECAEGSLSRRKFPNIDHHHYFERLFDLEYPVSAAKIAKDNENDILFALLDYMEKNKLNSDVNFISNKIKSNAKYKDIIYELLKRANMQPDSSDAMVESKISEAETPQIKIAHKLENTTGSESAPIFVDQRYKPNNAEILEEEKSKEKKSLLEEFDSVISKYRFVEFIRSEPLREYVESPEINAEELESRRVEYEDKMSGTTKSFAKSLGGEYAAYGLNDVSQDKILPYSINKLLSPTLLNMSERFVDTLITKIIPTIEKSKHLARANILEFKNNLKIYNEFLRNHLKPKGDYFVYDLESVVRDEKALNEQGSMDVMDVIVRNLIKNKKIDGNRISLEYTLDTENEDDVNGRLRGFNSKSNDFRDMLYALYNEIRNDIFISPDF